MEEAAQETKEETPKEESTQTETPNKDDKPLNTTKTKKSKKQLIISIVIVTVIIGILAGGYLIGQNSLNNKTSEFAAEKKKLTQQIASQSAQLNKLAKEKTDLNARVTFLGKSLKEATASSNFEFGTLSIPLATATQFTYEEEGVTSVDLLLVDVTLKNDTEKTLFLSTLSFKLKDTDNKSYPRPDRKSYVLPSGKVLLFDQQMAAGETVSGTVVFQAPKSIKLFTLLYEKNERTLIVK